MPVTLKLYATIFVLFLVIRIYFGGSGSIADADMKTPLAALMGIVALGGFVMRQWLKYQHRALRHYVTLIQDIYFHNVNNNAGIFDYLIATAEDQETKEAVLAYHFIDKTKPAPTAAETAARIETWLARNFGVSLEFKIAHALETLNRFGLVRQEDERLTVVPLDLAIQQLHQVWNNFFERERAQSEMSGLASPSLGMWQDCRSPNGSKTIEAA